jgi:predicted nuclease of restriction endonuclease-like (RecB) superfamily
LAAHIARTQPGLRGFARPNLYRMRQFYEAYEAQPNVSALLRHLSWTHHLAILGQCKQPEERQFYIELSIREKWSSRELECQIKGALFERSILQPAKVSAALKQMHPAAQNLFRDGYLVEFLELPGGHDERDLHEGLILRLKDFLLELGRDFCFVGSQYVVQVGSRDFVVDLLFFHRNLNCLVAFELKVGRSEPEYLGKLKAFIWKRSTAMLSALWRRRCV